MIEHRSPRRRAAPLALTAILLAIAADAGAAAGHPAIPVWDAPTLTRICDTSLARLNRQVQALAGSPLAKADAKSVFGAWNRLQVAQEDVEAPVYLLNSVSPDKKVRDAADECLLKYNKYGTALFQNAALYQRIRAVKPGDAVAAKLRKNLLEAFEDTGVALPAEKRTRMKDILARLESIRQDFERNVRDNKTRLAFAADEMKGLPQAYLERAKRDDQGNYLLGFEYPEYLPFMDNAENEDARRRYQTAFVSRGGERNIELLKEAMTLRQEIGALSGLPSYAHYVTRRRMAGKPEVVHKFLDEVKAAVRELEMKEIEDLRQVKAERLGQPLASVKLNRWDAAFYQERVKQQRYNIDQEALRQYFPTDAAVDWALHISSTLYGVRFRRAEAPFWHQDVRYYEVVDSGNGRFLAGIYLDLFPREGKYNHAAAFPVRGSSTLAKRTPISVLVTNFNRVGLDFNEMETLVHEFGHVLHGALSRTRYLAHAGTSVETDFVEAPSQMYEEWARKLESIRLLRKFCKECPEVTGEMVARLKDAHNFGRGIRYARQHLYASYDMALYNEHPGEPLAIWKKMEGETPLGYVPSTSFPGQFNHIISNYGAGYYGYMWSEVLALDMLSQYGDDLMNPAVGRRFRKEILERGGERSGADLTRAFLGRDPSPKAFFAEIAGQRLK